MDQSPWRPIAELDQQVGQSVFLAGGYIEEREFDFEHRDDQYPCDMATLPVRATWLLPLFSGLGQWIVTAYDSGVCAVEYHDPTHWMPIPPLKK